MTKHDVLSSGQHSSRTAKVFYTIFVDDMVMLPNNPAVLSSEDGRDVGSIFGSSIPPPRTINSLKRAICQVEQIVDFSACYIFETGDEDEPLDDHQKLDLTSDNYPGADLKAPIVLVIRTSALLNAILSSQKVPNGGVAYPKEITSSAHTFLGHTDSVNAVTFSPDGTLLASASTDRTVRISRVGSGTLVSLLHHSDIVTSVVFAPDGSGLATGCNDRYTRIWEPITGSCVKTLGECDGYIRSIAFSPDGLGLASASYKAVAVHHTVSGDLRGKSSKHTEPVESIAFSSDNSQIVSGSSDRSVRIWDAASITCTATLHGHSGPVMSTLFSPDSSLIASGSSDQTINLWDAASRKVVTTLHSHSGAVTSVTFSPDGQQLASGSAGGTTLWNLVSGTPVVHLRGHIDTVNCVAFSADGSMLVSGSADKTVRIWVIA